MKKERKKGKKGGERDDRQTLLCFSFLSGDEDYEASIDSNSLEKQTPEFVQTLIHYYKFYT